jgi:hypothetical protein
MLISVGPKYIMRWGRNGLRNCHQWRYTLNHDGLLGDPESKIQLYCTYRCPLLRHASVNPIVQSDTLHVTSYACGSISAVPRAWRTLFCVESAHDHFFLFTVFICTSSTHDLLKATGTGSLVHVDRFINIFMKLYTKLSAVLTPVQIILIYYCTIELQYLTSHHLGKSL